MHGRIRLLLQHASAVVHRHVPRHSTPAAGIDAHTEDNADAVAPSWLEGADAAQPNLCDIRVGLDKNNKLQANWTIALCYYESEGTPSLKKPALKKALQASMLSQGSQQFGRINVTKGRI